MISKKLVSIMAVILLSISIFGIVFTFNNTLAKANTNPIKQNVAPSGDLSISNNILAIAIQDALNDSGIGVFTASTDSGHPNPDQNVLFGGAAMNPWSSFTTIRVEDTKKEYVTNSPFYPKSPSTGYTVAYLDNYNPVVTQLSATSAQITWKTAENLQITMLISIHGTTLADTAVEVTVTVKNTDTVAHSVALRHEWDLMIDGNDNSWIRAWNNPTTAQSWTNTETDWTAPNFQFWETTNDPTNPIFSIYGSVSLPATSPAPTVPDRLVYASWPSSYGTAYTYTPTSQIGDDSTMLYYYNAVNVNPGAQISRTAYMTTVVQSSLSSSVMSTDSAGNSKQAFVTSDNVYVKGSSFPANINVQIYIIPDGLSATTSNAVANAAATTTSIGDIPNALVWHPTLTVGNYDIWVDVNKNGVFDAGDVINNQAGGIYPFSVTAPTPTPTPTPTATPTPTPLVPSTNITLTVVNGTSSYYTSTLSGVPAGFVIQNGVYMGWCADRSTVMVRSVPHSVELFSSLSNSLPSSINNATVWHAVNYILNHKQGSMQQIQDAIWYFAPDNFAPPTSETNAWAMINAAIANPTYVPTSGQTLAVIAFSGSSSGVQNTLIELILP